MLRLARSTNLTHLRQLVQLNVVPNFQKEHEVYQSTILLFLLEVGAHQQQRLREFLIHKSAAKTHSQMGRHLYANLRYYESEKAN